MKISPTYRGLFAGFLLAWCAWIGSRFVDLDTETGGGASTVLALLVAIGGLLAAMGAGKAVCFKLHPDLLDDELGWLHCLVTGLLVWGLLGLGLGCLGAISMSSSLALGVLMLGGWAVGVPIKKPAIGPIECSLLAFILIFGIVNSIAPPVDTDELYYHLAIPQKILSSGELVGGLLQPNGSRPLIVHLPFASLMALGGDSAPRLFHLGLSSALILGVGAVGRRHLSGAAGTIAMLILLGCGSVIQEFGLASNNLPTALCVLAAMDAGLQGKPRLLAVAAGAALSCKYSAAAPIAAIFIVAALPWKTRIGVGIAALALVSPWWIRNLFDGLHPFFPFAGWPAPDSSNTATPVRFFYLEKYGAGRDLQAMLMLPWNAVMTSSFSTFRFLGRLNPALLGLLPLALLGVRKSGHRKILIAAVAGFVGWGAGAHWIRHLLPVLPLWALACGGGLDLAIGHAQKARVLVMAAACLVGLSGLAANLGPVAKRTADRISVAMGSESELEYLRRAVDGYPAIEWANSHLPQEARIALLFEWTGFLLERENLLGSVEDHVPTRHFVLRHGDQSLERLRELGVSHVIARKTHFLKKIYPFLSNEDFERSFSAPEETLENLLLMEATLVFESNRTRVYRLDEG